MTVVSTLGATHAVIFKQTGCENLESSSTIFSEFYAVLMHSDILPNDDFEYFPPTR